MRKCRFLVHFKGKFMRDPDLSLALARLSLETQVSHCPLQSRTFPGRIPAVPGRSRRMTVLGPFGPTFGARQIQISVRPNWVTFGDQTRVISLECRRQESFICHG